MELNNKSTGPFRLLGFFAYFGAEISIEGKVYWSLRMDFLFLSFFCLSGTQALGIICALGRNQHSKNHSCTGKAFFLLSNLYHLKKMTLNCNMNLYKL